MTDVKYAVEHLRMFRPEDVLFNCEFILVLHNYNECIHSSFIHKLGNRNGVVIQGEEALQILSLYSLYEFSDKVIIGSFDEPHGRKLRNLLDSGIATEETLIDDVILGAM
jgi:hypothetical protein